MRNGLEWDQITAMATAAYNYFPNMSAKESAFFLMYGRDPVNKLSSILNAPRRYLCDNSGLPDLEALKNMYQMVAQQLYNSRQHYIKDNKYNKYNKVPGHGILVGNLVLMKDHTAKSFEPKNKEDYRVVQIYGTNALQVSDKRGKLHNVHITDVRRINMTEKVATQLEQMYNKGRTAKNLIPPGLIPDLGWNTDQQGSNRQPLPTEKQPEVTATRIMPTQVEGPPSSRLRSKTSKNNLPYEQDQQDPPEHNRNTVDLPSITYEVNQLQIIGTTRNRMQVVLPVMLIVILLLINVFLFQIMNDAESMPFAYMVKAKNPCIPPKVVKKPPFWQITQNSLTIFQFGLREMETSNFTANCTKSTQFANPHSESREISAIHANF